MTIKALGCACVAVASLIGATPAPAEEFTLLIYETSADIALRGDSGEEGRAYWQAYADFGKKLDAAGAIRGGAPLVPDQATATGDGLVLGGYFRIEAPTLKEAQALADAAPPAKRHGRTVLAKHSPMMAK